MKKIIFALLVTFFTRTATCAAHNLTLTQGEQKTLMAIGSIFCNESSIYPQLYTRYPQEFKKFVLATLVEMRCTKDQRKYRISLLDIDISSGDLWYRVYARIHAHNGLNSISHIYALQCFPLKILGLNNFSTVDMQHKYAQKPDTHEQPPDNITPTSNKRMRRD